MLSLMLGVGLGVGLGLGLGLGWFALKLRLGWEFQSGLVRAGVGFGVGALFGIMVVRVLVVALVVVYGQGLMWCGAEGLV